MNCTTTHRVLIAGDSRLRYLASTLADISSNFDFTIRSLPGAKISDITQYAAAALTRPNDYHLVILMGGINNMSRLAYHPTKHALPRFGNTDELINRTMDAIRSAMHEVRSISQTPIVISTIAGMELAKYSPAYADLLRPLQRDFNSAIVQVNGQIRGVNRLAGLNTINLAYPVHRCKGSRGRYTTQYSFLFDGLHPSDDLLARYKYLGYNIDEQLSCKHIFSDTVSKLNCVLHTFRKIRPSLSFKAAIAVLKAKFISYIDYILFFSYLLSKKDFKKLQVLQNHCIRCVFKLPSRSNVDSHHAKLKMLHLENRRHLFLMTYMYRQSQALPDPSLHLDGTTTRSSLKRNFPIPMSHNSRYEKSHLNQGRLSWNDLPLETQRLPDIYLFKRHLRKHLLDSELALYGPA